ncbi:MAG: phosphatase PAP2 family protein [Actinomycetota bacterium]|nr:phosphatase PAP2 family protein [Actinomycetota bacterium]
MPIDARRAQPRHPRIWWWGIAVPGLVLAVTTLLVSTSWQPVTDLDVRIAASAYDLTAGHRTWIAVLDLVAEVSRPIWLRSVMLIVATVLLWRGHVRVGTWLTLVTAVEWVVAPGLKFLVERPRPAWEEPLHQIGGFAYPSEHAAGAAYFAAAGVILALLALPRGRVRAALCTGLVLVAVAIGLHRILLGVHYASDVIGGWSLGVLVVMSGGALLLRLRPEEPGPVVGTVGVRPSRLAVIVNPVKVGDVTAFRALVRDAAAAHGWDEPLWFETTLEDPGTGMAEAALAADVEMVLVAGGDGTVRVVCTELARTGVSIGVVPLGTGNLLARNLGIPLHGLDAVEVALSGQDRAVDAVSLGGDDLHETCFMVMAGLGLDAAIMEGAREHLKARMGWTAYVVSALRQLRYPAMTVEIAVDDRPPVRRRARTVVVGNVGSLQAGIPLLPDARIDDGMLDVVVIAPRRLLGWLPLVARVLARGRRTDERLDRMTGRSVVVRAERVTPRQLDGDPILPGREIRAQVMAGTLLVRVPRLPR